MAFCRHWFVWPLFWRLMEELGRNNQYFLSLFWGFGTISFEWRTVSWFLSKSCQSIIDRTECRGWCRPWYSWSMNCVSTHYQNRTHKLIFCRLLWIWHYNKRRRTRSCDRCFLIYLVIYYTIIQDRFGLHHRVYWPRNLRFIYQNWLFFI